MKMGKRGLDGEFSCAKNLVHSPFSFALRTILAHNKKESNLLKSKISRFFATIFSRFYQLNYM